LILIYPLLAISQLVKTLIEMHGGTVNVESKKGEGSTFTIRLPVAGPDQSEQADTWAA